MKCFRNARTRRLNVGPRLENSGRPHRQKRRTSVPLGISVMISRKFVQFFTLFRTKSHVRYGLKPLKCRQKRIVSIILNRAEKLPLVGKLSILTKQFNNLGETCPAEQIKVDSSWRMLSASFDVSIESVLCWSFCCVRTSPPLVWMSDSDGRQRDLMS